MNRTRTLTCGVTDRLTDRLKTARTRAQLHEKLLAAQDGRCALCGTTEPGGRGGERFHVDHDHDCCPGNRSCGKCIRALLCASCNVGLGSFRDDPDRLLAAAAYLISRRGVRVDAVD